MNIQNLGTSVRALLDQNQHVAFDFEAELGAFSVISFEASEAVNAPFEITIELAAHDPNIALSELMDSEARLGIYDRYQEPRFLHGVITDISRGIGGAHRSFYQATLRPALWRLSQTSDSRIWQSQSVPDIAANLLSEHGIKDIEWRLAETHQPREFLTQREERHLDFLTRILAEEGIYYFFEHSADGHKLVFTDAPLATPALPHAPELTYNATPGGSSPEPHIRAFHLHERLRSSDYELNDFTFKNPNARMNESRSAQEHNTRTQNYALYDYPGRYKDPAKVGKTFAKTRIEAARVDATTGTGKTNSVHLSPGFAFEITDHDYDAANTRHFLLDVKHSGQQPAALEEEAGQEPTTYEASFTTMPARLPYRPPTPAKPKLDGPQIAIVTGPEGEEIYTDAHGRVKCWFPWDRHSAKDENASCWIRVTHASSGMQYGHAAIPRIGSEVLVEYLDGDPDQPIITGMAYNPTKKHAYDLPANKTKSYWKDRTHKGEGFNEIRFESEQGKEEIYVHAQKDRNEKTRNNHTERIDNNWVQSVGAQKIVQVEQNHDEQISGNMSIRVGKSADQRFISKALTQATEGIGKFASTITAPILSTVGAGVFSLFSEKSIFESTLGIKNQYVGVSKSSHAGQSQNLSAGQMIELSAGNAVTVQAGYSITVNSDGELMIFVGNSKIMMNKSGDITLSGRNLFLDFEENIEINAEEKLSQDASEIEHNSDKNYTVKAQKIKLN